MHLASVGTNALSQSAKTPITTRLAAEGADSWMAHHWVVAMEHQEVVHGQVTV